MKLNFLLPKGNSNSHAMREVSNDGDFSVIGMIICMD